MPDNLRYQVPFCQIPHEIITDERTTSYHIAAFCTLAMHANAERRAWPSTRRLAKIMKMGRAKMISVLQELESFGWIVRTKRSSAKQHLTTIYALSPSLQGGSDQNRGVVLIDGGGGSDQIPKLEAENYTREDGGGAPLAEDTAVSPAGITLHDSKPPNALKDPVADLMQMAFDSRVPAVTWSNFPRERKTLNTLAKLIRAITTEPRAMAKALMVIFWDKKQSSEKWWHVPFTPTSMLIRWNDLLDQFNDQLSDAQSLEDHEEWANG
jgi:hypothetical protein